MKALTTSLVLIAFAVCVSSQQHAVGQELIHDFVVTAIDQVDVPALEMGIVDTLVVKEGDSVTQGQLIGKLDDRQSQLQAALAKTEYSIARKLSENHLGTELAGKQHSHQQELAKQHDLAHQIATRIAANDLKIKASEKAAAVAKNELVRATKSRQKFAESVSQSEIDSLRLGFEKSLLDAAQASFDREIDALNAKSEEEAKSLYKLKIDQSSIQLQQALVQKDVMEMQTTAKQHATALADLAVQRHQVLAPIAGVIAKRYLQVGQWVKPGDPIVKVVRLDRLRAEGFASLPAALKIRDRESVSLLVQVGNDEVRLEGKVTFISPEVNPVDGRVRVFVEFDNSDGAVLPGCPASISVE